LTVFAGYSRYYDLLYRNKDYAGEARYVADLIESHAPSSRSVMEIGCGTGAHAAELASIGYEVTGVDMSAGMLEGAEARRKGLATGLALRINFAQGDARTVRLDRRFNAVISLFHVMSYQTTNQDLAAAFETARQHLLPGGVFIFDCWYGPAVLRQWPSVTEKTLSDEHTHVHRVATPEIDPNRNVVDVNYVVDVADQKTGVTETLRETHSMRYLFTPEIELALAVAGMKLIDSRAWMSAEPPGFDSWGAVYVARG
jgi:SAM-dependent methyltransferase